MTRKKSVAIGCLLGVAVVVGWVSGSAGVDQEQPSDRSSESRAVALAQPDGAGGKTPAQHELSEFMRKKLDASSLILEGLLTEDPKTLLKGAEQLKRMSEAEQWRVSNDIMYRNHSDDFHKSVDKLIVAAKGTSIDRAALTWFDTTLSCIDCHRYVRTMLIADSAAPLSLPVR